MHVRVANLPDRCVRYLESGSGRALVLLHAFPLSADQWLPQLHRLPPGWRAVAPDLRGFRGHGPAFADVGLESATVDTHARDVLALMTHLDIDRAVVAGLSMGGYIAFALLRAAPERLSGLVLANTRATPDSAEALEGRDRMIALARSQGPAAIAREMVPKLLGETSRREQPDLAQVVTTLIERNTVDAMVSALQAMKTRPDSTPLLASIACPTLVVAGGEDVLVTRSEMDRMQRAIPGANFTILERAGHLTNLEAPTGFIEALSGFLYGVARR